MRMRRGEPERPVFRRPDRIFWADRAWYFETREGIDYGPYTTREEAEGALEAFLLWQAPADDVPAPHDRD